MSDQYADELAALLETLDTQLTRYGVANVIGLKGAMVDIITKWGQQQRDDASERAYSPYYHRSADKYFKRAG